MEKTIQTTQSKSVEDSKHKNKLKQIFLIMKYTKKIKSIHACRCLNPKLKLISVEFELKFFDYS